MDFDDHALNSTYFHQQKQFLVLSMELQETRLRAEEDLKSRDAQILHLKELLAAAVKERDEARDNCKRILFEKLLLHQSAPNSAISSIEEDDPTRGIDSANAFSSSDCDESIASSPQRLPPPPEFPLAIKGPLPEKGKLLQAVVRAGPLLQTLLLAGSLPQWRHPPPPVDPYQIPPPPVAVPPTSTLPALPPHFLRHGDDIGTVNDWTGAKRGPPEITNWSNELKRQTTKD
ncbi:uncharacterized protein LOC131003678 [Salvia miltiorrhiza]|uniref:uncharacterized protein LOC131003678 n=1 Tax=Salvia miltiorrhiza TaxID=226208 RepID=UPI0025ABCF45|nr:uncharacterized protein LOC131003678 [Salvia miltiorrhiza]